MVKLAVELSEAEAHLSELIEKLGSLHPWGELLRRPHTHTVNTATSGGAPSRTGTWEVPMPRDT